MTKPSVVARESQHTPAPWTWEENGSDGKLFTVRDAHRNVLAYSGSNRDRATWRLIFNTVNSHKALIDALQALAEQLRNWESNADRKSERTSAQSLAEQAEQALRLAQGEK